MWRASSHRPKRPARPRGEVAEWLKAADCKSARASVRWFESSPLHQHTRIDLARNGPDRRRKEACGNGGELTKRTRSPACPEAQCPRSGSASEMMLSSTSVVTP